MPSCAVATCRNTQRNTKGKNVIFHRFPQVNEELSREWMQRCKRKDAINPKNARICSDHFLLSDYIDDMRNRLLGLPLKKKLKDSSVPSINLASVNNTTTEVTSRAERHKKRNIFQSANDRLKNLSPIKVISDQNIIMNYQTCENCDDLKKEVESLKLQLTEAEKKIAVLRKAKIQRERMITQKLKRNSLFKINVTNQLKQQKKKMDSLSKEKANLEKVKKSVSGIFSEKQLNSLMENKRIKWTPEDISQSIVLRAISSKAYDFWKYKIGFPLPSASTLKRWCAKFTCSPGILHDVLLLMKKNCENCSPMDKLCVLSFDEMHIDSKLSYDAKLDEILGPFKKVLVVLIRGLTSSWKQPIYFNFDKLMNKELLMSIIKSVETIGIKVVAIVSDLGGSQTLWKELEISEKKSCFNSPSDLSSKIWVFADLPHYLKLLRNHFLDKGLILSDGTFLDSSIIHKTMEEDPGEIKLCHKLKPHMLYLKGNERQKVAPAKILFSSTTAKAISHCTGNIKASEFFLMIDNFFDIMNSKCLEPPSHKPLKAAFGNEKFLDSQVSLLKIVKKEISELRVSGRKSMLPFQKGIVISINSLLGLQESLKSHDIKYILTSRLTQDVLESLFSQIRGLGRFNDHPSPSEVIIRLKRLLLANKLPNLSSKINHTNTSENAYLTSEMLQNAFNSDDETQSSEIFLCETETEDDFENFEDLSSNKSDLKWESENNISKNEEEALCFIAGFIAYKIKEKYDDPSFGEKTKNASNIPPYANWIALLSAGGLTVPSPTWMETVKEMDGIFRQIHGNNFRKGKDVIKNMTKKLQSRFPNIRPQAIHLFSRIRTFIRIRYLNRSASLVSIRKAQQKANKWKK